MGAEATGGRLGRDFVLLWQGQLVSQLGNQAFLVATMSWALEATGSPALMGLLLAASTLPAVVVGPLAGAVVDRHSRRALVVGADLVRGLGHLALAAVMFGLPEATSTIVALLFGMGILSGAMGAVVNPALAAAIPDLVPPRRLAAANSLHHVSIHVATLTGQALGGVAFASLGAGLLILFDGVTFLVSAGCARLARIPRPPARAPSGMRSEVGAYAADVRAGFAWLWRHRYLRALALTFAGVNVLFMPVFVLLPVYVRDRLAQGPEWYGFLLAAAGAGALAGTAMAPRVLRTAPGLAGAVAGIGAATVALGTSRSAAMALAMLFAIGSLSGILNVRVMTILQASTPSELRGRVLAVTIALAGAAVPAGLVLGGAAGEMARPHLGGIVAGCGLGILVLAAVLWSASPSGPAGAARVSGSADPE
ncbi:MAG TPA: MFS transporter [Vicinamibacteria bacterium]|nr:MFS transporter [Vicinamibacteria bacterium]